MEEKNSIVIKRVKKVQGGHHGGSWKIAMADFAIAMMAFFLLMWLLANTTEAQKIELEKFFIDPVGYMDKIGRLTAIDLGGSPAILNNFNPSADSDQIEASQMLNVDDPEQLAAGTMSNADALSTLQSTLVQTVQQSETLKQFEDQLDIDVRPDGLHIQIVDNKLRPMFDAGGDKLKLYFAEILLQLAPVIAQVNNKISINGHTDAAGYSDTDYFSNWELSTQRANAARRMLIEGGLPVDQVAQITGFASSQLFKPDEPEAPINRRIEIVVLNRPVVEEMLEDSRMTPEQEEQVRESEVLIEQNAPPQSQLSADEAYDPTKEPQRTKRAESTFGDTGEVVDQDDVRPVPSGKPEEVLNSLDTILSQPEKPYEPPPEVE